MDLWDLLKVAVRQWRVLVPLLVLTIAAAVFVSGSVAPEYSASGSIVLIGPSATPGEPAQPPVEPGDAGTPAVEPSPVNPYLSFNSSLAITAEVLSLRLTSAQAVGAMADAGMATTYEVNLTPRSPILQMTVKGDDAATVVATLDRLIEMAGGELEQLQSTGGAPESQRAAIDVLSRSNAAAPDASGAQRVRLLVLALGVAASVAVAYATEGLLALRRARSSKQQDHDRDERDVRDEWDDRQPVPPPAGHAVPAPRGEERNGQYVGDRRGTGSTGRGNGGPPPVRRPPVVDAPVARAIRAANGRPLRASQDEAPVAPRPTWPQR